MSIDASAIRAAVENRREEILDWTRAFLRFPSENRPPRGAEADAQTFLARECRNLGWATDEFRPTDVSGIEDHRYWLPGREYAAGRRNVVARWKGTGGGRSILFSGHVDVAPFEPDNWKVCRPFEPTVVDGRLYGRGTADMKGGIAAAFWAMRILKESGMQPRGDVLFESVVDEEYAGGNGTLASRLKGYNADLAILTEPTRMQVCTACIGAFLGDLTIFGKAGMPFTGSAVPNPVFAAGRAIHHFKEWQDTWRRENSHPLFDEPGKELNVLLSDISSAVPGEFLQMGTPLRVAISWIIWCYPGMTEDEFYRRFRAYWHTVISSDPGFAGFDVKLTPSYHFVRPWQTPPEHPGVRATVEAFRAMTGRQPVVGGAPFSCDLGLYGDPGGMPSIILGPRGDNLHAPDEWVLLEDIYTLAEVFALHTASWCG
jgi:acetylornithine deacetylase